MIALQGACVAECMETGTALKATNGTNLWLLFPYS